MAESASGSTFSRTFVALGHPGFRRYYIGQGISLVGTWLQAAAVRWLVYERTGSEFMLGVLEVASLLPGILVGLYAGALADRIAPLRMIVLMECGQMALAFILSLLIGLQVVQIWQMALILALARICVTFELPSRQVFFYDLVGPEILSNAIALNSGLFNATRVLGPALAGVCLYTAGGNGLLRPERGELPGGHRRAAVDPAHAAFAPSRGAHASRPPSAGSGTCEVTGGSSRSLRSWPSSAWSAWATRRWCRPTRDGSSRPRLEATAPCWPVAASARRWARSWWLRWRACGTRSG